MDTRWVLNPSGPSQLENDVACIQRWRAHPILIDPQRLAGSLHRPSQRRGHFQNGWGNGFGGISVGDPGADLLVLIVGEPCQVQRLVDGCQRMDRSGGFGGESGCNSRRRAFAPALPFGMAFEMSWLPIGRLRLDVPLCPGAQADFASTDLIAAGPRTGWPGSRLHVAEPISGRRT